MSVRLLSLAVFLVGVNLSVSAQESSSPSQQVAVLLKKADASFEAAEYERAMQELLQAEGLVETANLDDFRSECYAYLARIHRAIGQAEEMYRYQELSESHLPAVSGKRPGVEALVVYQRAVLYYENQQLDSAFWAYQRSIELYSRAEEPLEAAKAWRNLGLAHYNFKNYSAAISAYREAMGIMENLPAQYPDLFAEREEQCVKWLSWAYLNLADVFFLLDDQAQVRNYFIRSQDLLDRYRSKYPLIAREARENQARFLDRMRRYEESIEMYQSIFDELPPGRDPRYEQRILLKIAQVYSFGLFDFQRSIDYWHLAIDHARRFNIYNESMVSIYRELGRCHLNLGQLDEARAAFDEGWRLLGENTISLQAAILYFNEARWLHAQGRYQEALATIDQGTSAFNFPPSSSLANIEVMHSMVYYSLYQEERQTQYLAAAEEWARKSLTTLEAYEDRIFQQRSYNTYYRKPTEYLLHCLYERYRLEADEAIVEEIYKLLEKSRGHRLRLGRTWEDQRLAARYPAELVEERTVLQRDRLRLMNERYQLERREQQNERYFELGDSLVALEEAMAGIRLETQDLAPLSRELISLSELQEELSGQAKLVVLFFAGDSTLFSLALDGSSYALADSRLSADKLQLLEDLGGAIRQANSSADELAAQLHQAYQLLLEPLLVELPQKQDQLIIVPDGVLTQLPWPALCTTSPKDDDYRYWPYLIRDYAVSILPYAGMAAEQMRFRELVNVASFAPSYPERPGDSDQGTLADFYRRGFWSLPGARREAEKVAGLYGRRSSLYAGVLSREQFVEQAADYSILHLAMHAVADLDDPSQSFLLFPAEERLTALELLELDLETELLVLSACYSGDGPWRDGDGVISLAYTLQETGVQSVLSNAWAVADQLSGDVMIRFHELLREGRPLDEALRQAQLTYLQKAPSIPAAHPFYWAGFYLQGDTAAFTPNHLGRPFWWLAGGALVLVGIWLVYRRNSRSSSAA